LKTPMDATTLILSLVFVGVVAVIPSLLLASLGRHKRRQNGQYSGDTGFYGGVGGSTDSSTQVGVDTGHHHGHDGGFDGGGHGGGFGGGDGGGGHGGH
jgi:hypothetical protein